jgi:hypothetical protein
MAGIIYCIKQTSTNKIYVGLTTDYVRRRNEHIYELRHGRHSNKHLQNAWNKYGESDFEFSILEKVSGTKEDLKQAEIRLIEELDGTNRLKGFNVSKGGDTAKWRAIKQYTKQGVLVKEYATISLAASELGKLSTPIWKALNGSIPTAHGYQWRYSDEDREVRQSVADHAHRGIVEQYSLEGHLLAEYSSAMEAARQIQHITTSASYKSVAINIRKVCQNQMKSYMNFIWKFKK